MHEHISYCKVFGDETFSSHVDICDANISLPQCLRDDKVLSQNLRMTNSFFAFLTSILWCILPCVTNCKCFSHKPLRLKLCPINLAQRSFHRPKNAICTGMHACVGWIKFSLGYVIFPYTKPFVFQYPILGSCHFLSTTRFLLCQRLCRFFFIFTVRAGPEFFYVQCESSKCAPFLIRKYIFKKIYLTRIIICMCKKIHH